uniref:Subtilisin-like protease fibronectin type-III domain-containing protein n=1 Tax=Setaria italica TaxID=4555 RepID=K3ZMM6_SETIT
MEWNRDLNLVSYMQCATTRLLGCIHVMVTVRSLFVATVWNNQTIKALAEQSHRLLCSTGDHSLALNDGSDAAELIFSLFKHLYIVYLGERQHEDADLVTASHHDMLASVLGSKEAAVESIVYSYKHAWILWLRLLPGVESIRKNEMHSVHTTRSWDFMGLPYNQPNGLLANAKMGADIIIGVLDSGIWPESPSFHDDGYRPPPSKWKGICQIGDSFGPEKCNGKIIGARWYTAGVDKALLNGEFLSPRDANDHGTHTASTAAGNLVHNVSLHGLAAGDARGGAPRARISVYKVCWGIRSVRLICSEAAAAKAIDDAIHDGVDVLSISMYGPLLLPASLHAVAKGISVTVQNMAPWLLTVAAATIDQLFPTTITLGRGQKLVGQSLFTDVKEGNRFHKLELFLNKNLMDIKSRHSYIFVHLLSVITYKCTKHTLFFPNMPLVFTLENSPGFSAIIFYKKNLYFRFPYLGFCFTTTTVLPVERLVQIAKTVRLNGGRGFIYTQHSTDLLDICTSVSMSTPCVAINKEVSYQIYQYYRTNKIPQAKISLTQTMIGGGILAPKVAAFSSQGPSQGPRGAKDSQACLIDMLQIWCHTAGSFMFLFPQPDIAAPGVNILAAAPQIGIYKEYGISYLNSGTSMSCPHVSGIVALLKSLHPDWSPAALKSALMTTALVTDNNGLPLLADGSPAKIADPFDFGAGFVNPIKASDPGLIYDIEPLDYQKLLRNCSILSDTEGTCPVIERSLLNLNLPSIAIRNLKTSETVLRTVTNVGQPDAVYKAFFEPPTGVEMSVEPTMLMFGKKRSQSFKVTFKAMHKVQGDYSFGNLVWHDGGSHWVRIPIAVRVVIQNLYSTVF